MNKLLKILLIISFTATSMFALKKDKIEEHMTAKVDTVLDILKKETLSTKEKGNQIIHIIDDIFDYKTMSRISIGKKWKTLTSEQREKFVKVFEEKLKNSYVGKLELYSDEKVKIISLEPYKKSRLQLKTQLVGKSESYDINYNFYRNKKTDDWLIYDVDLIGVSIIQTYRKQFSGLLKEQSFDEMLKTLEDANK